MYSFPHLVEEAARDHAIAVTADTGPDYRPVGYQLRCTAPEQVATAAMLYSNSFRRWTGQTVDAQGRHVVRGAKGRVLEWLLCAMVDGPSPQYAKRLGIEYQLR